jgi:hypothetical protein
MKEERYQLLGQKPELVTCADGRVISLHSGHKPIALLKDSKFSRLRLARRLRKVMGKVPAAPAPAPVPEPSPAPSPAPTIENESDPDGSVYDLGLRYGLAENLYMAGYKTVGDLRNALDEDLLEIDGVGPKSLFEVHEVLSRLE